MDILIEFTEIEIHSSLNYRKLIQNWGDSLVSLILSGFVLMSYFGVPVLAFISIVILELDPVSYLIRHMFVETIPGMNMRLLIFLLCYTCNILALYEMSRMICLGFSSVIYCIHCISTSIKICPLFLTKIRKLYDLHVLIMWYQFWQIQVAIAEFVVRNTVSVGLLGCCTFTISVSYTIIRLHAIFSEYIVSNYACLFVYYPCR